MTLSWLFLVVSFFLFFSLPLSQQQNPITRLVFVDLVNIEIVHTVGVEASPLRDQIFFYFYLKRP